MKRFYHTFSIGLIVVTLFTFLSCSNDDTISEVIWEIPLSAKFQNPGLANRTETGMLIMRLYSNTKLDYSFVVRNLDANDVLTSARFYAGDVLTNGDTVLNLIPTFLGSKASGTIFIRQSLADSLRNTANDIYFNVHSQQEPNGLVRGQVNTDIILAADIALTGANQVPPVVTTATGTAAIRLTAYRKLYSNITVTNLESTDVLTTANIYSGGSTVNGAVLLTLCNSASDFGVIKVQDLSKDLTTTLLNTDTYINVSSTQHTSGVVRGQLVNAIK